MKKVSTSQQSRTSIKQERDQSELDVPVLPVSTDSSRPDPNLPLPLDTDGILKLTANHFVSERTIILGQSGWGKGNAGALIAEHLLEHGLPMTVIDLEGEAWPFKELHRNLLVVGRSAHADREYRPEQMGRLAELSVEQGFSVVLDLSDYEEDEYYALLVPYLKSVWVTVGRRRTPYLLVIDEAHEYVPQNGKTPVKGLLIQMAKRGRKRGLGMITMSQETASVDNQLLKQTGIRILLPVSYAADFDRYQTLIPGMSRDAIEKTIPHFPPGKGFVIYKHTPTLVQLRRRRTFDPSETPKLGTGMREPVLQAVDDTTLQLLDDSLPDSTHEILEQLDRATLIRRIRALQEARERTVQQPKATGETVSNALAAESASFRRQVVSLRKQLTEAQQELAHLHRSKEHTSSASSTTDAHLAPLQEALAKKEKRIESLEEQLHLVSQLTVTLTGIPSLEELLARLRSFHLDEAPVRQVESRGERTSEPGDAHVTRVEQALLATLERLSQRVAQLLQQDTETQHLRDELARLAQDVPTLLHQHPQEAPPSSPGEKEHEQAEGTFVAQLPQQEEAPPFVSLAPREERRLRTLLQDLHRPPFSRFHRELVILLLLEAGRAFSYEEIAQGLHYEVGTVEKTSTVALQKKGLVARAEQGRGYVLHFSDFCQRRFPGADEQILRRAILQGLSAQE
jgi:hypothetical protein